AAAGLQPHRLAVTGVVAHQDQMGAAIGSDVQGGALPGSLRVVPAAAQGGDAAGTRRLGVPAVLAGDTTRLRQLSFAAPEAGAGVEAQAGRAAVVKHHSQGTPGPEARLRRIEVLAETASLETVHLVESDAVALD